MYKGGRTNKPFTANSFRYAKLLLPIFLATYGLLIEFDFISSPRDFSFLELFAITFWTAVISIAQFVRPSRSRHEIALRLFTYHIIIGAYLIFISGFASPIIGCWFILIIVAYAYFSDIGLQLSLMAFVAATSMNIILWSETDEFNITLSLVALITILLTGTIVTGVTKSNKVTRREFIQSKTQESLHRDRTLTIINSMTDGVISTNMEGVIQVYNAASLNLIDTNISLNGRHIDEMLKLFDQDSSPVSLFTELKKIKTITKRDDLNFKFSDGEEMRLEITCSPIRSSFSRSKTVSTHDGYIIIMRDITKAKSLEEERDEFISVVSHELRTPITITEGTLSNIQLMMTRPNISNKSIIDGVNTAHDQVIFLANMVNDLSTLSRAERGVLADKEDIDVRELAHKLFDKYNDEAVKKGLQLDLDLAPNTGQVRTSRLYLEELLQNFITNAIKYTKEGDVKIIIEKSAGNIRFAVKDSGIGISKSDQSKVFNKFYRSEDYRTRETGGTGLGLYVAAKLSKMIGARIELKSRLNFGSTFSFELPELKEK